MLITSGSEGSPNFHILQVLDSDKYAFNPEKVKIHQNKECNTASEIKFWDNEFTSVPDEELLNWITHFLLVVNLLSFKQIL
jgi:hypothetical protein